jgi:hypothetical protein
MKSMKKLTILAAVAILAIGGLGWAQTRHAGAPGHSVLQDHGNSASMAKHLGEMFPRVASFDANKDRKLDETEREALRKAIADGKLQLPAHTPPNGVKPTVEKMVNHIGEMYAYIAGYDVNHDGELDATEQAAIRTAIEKGEFPLHGQH